MKVQKVRLIPGVGPAKAGSKFGTGPAKMAAEKFAAVPDVPMPMVAPSSIPAAALEIARMPPIVVPKELGPAMTALNNRQRKFVLAWVGMGLVHGSIVKAYWAAGYKQNMTARTNASKLARQKNVLAAVAEEVALMDAHMGWRAKAKLGELVESSDEDIALKAAKTTLEYTGAMIKRTELRVTHEVETLSPEQIDKRIAELWQKLSPQERARLGVASNVVEGEFSEAAESVVELREVEQSQTGGA